MANQHVAWSINARNEVSLIHTDFQGPPFLGETKVIDISYSVSETVFILFTNEGNNFIEYGKNEVPNSFKSVSLLLPGGVQVSKIDASPADKVYMVLSNGTLAEMSAPEGSTVEPTIVAGSDGVAQVSAAPDGKVWVIAYDGTGSVVKFKNLDSADWNTVPDLNNATRVTGTNDGQAYVVKSDGSIILVNAEGPQKEVPSEFPASEISVGADGTLWVIAQGGGFDGGSVYTSTNEGAQWHQVPNAEARYLDAGTLAVAEVESTNES